MPQHDEVRRVHPLQRFATIGVMASAIMWNAPARGPEPSFQRPIVDAISIGNDTVWFCGRIGAQVVPVNFFWLRPTREWKRAVATNHAPCAHRLGQYGNDPADTNPLGSGIRVIRVDGKRADNNAQIGPSHLRIVDSAKKRTTDLDRVVDTALVHRLTAEGEEIEIDTISAYVGAAVANDSLVWVGLGGGFPEGQGEIGGIYRLDRRTGKHELIFEDRLAAATVTGIASVGHWLWVATEYPAEYGPFGDAGLLRMDQITRTWTSYDASISPIPDALIRTMKSDGKILAMATETGLAVIELHPASGTAAQRANEEDPIARWNLGYFTPTFVGDSLVFDIGANPHGAMGPTDEERYTFVQMYADLGHERHLFAALARINVDSLSEAMVTGRPEDTGAILADSALIPDLIAMMQARKDGLPVAAYAIGSFGQRAPASAVAELRSAFAAMDAPPTRDEQRRWNRSILGRSLAMTGDSTSVLWARAELQRVMQTRKGEAGAAAEILASAHDRTGLGLIISVIPTTGEIEYLTIIRALAGYDDVNAWGAMVSFARAKRLPRQAVLDALTPAALRDTSVAKAANGLLREIVADSTNTNRWAAAFAAGRLQMIGLAPDLVSLLEPGRLKRADDAWWAIRALVTLSGRADAPVYADSLPPRSIFEWWQNWLSAAGGKPAVSEEDGRKAVNAWNARYDALRRPK